MEAPHLQQLQNRYRSRGLRVVGVTPLGSLAEMRRFVQRHRLTYPTAVDARRKVAALYGVRRYPVTVLVGKDGVVRSRTTGFQPGEERRLETQIQRALKGALTGPDQARGGPS